MNVLVVAAHPDDEVLGAGGAMARHSAAGDAVAVAILGSGLSSRLQNPEQLDTAALQELRTNAHSAADVLGVSDLRLFDLPDNRFDSVDRLEVIKTVESVVETVQPQLVYTHFPGDLNIDHRRTAEAVLTACRPLPGSPVRRILAMDVASATGWGDPATPFSPTVFLDIAGVLPRKLQAMAAYRGEMREFPHPRSLPGLEARAAYWGSQAGMTAAEPFVLLREILP